MPKRITQLSYLMAFSFVGALLAVFTASEYSNIIVTVALIIGLTAYWHIYQSFKETQQNLSDTQHLASFNQQGDQQAKLSYFAHEVRTPMNGIIGMLDLIDCSDVSEETKHYIDTARKASQNLLFILNNNIDAAKSQKDELAFTVIPDNLAEVCEHVVKLNAGSAEYKGIDFNLHMDPRLLGYTLIFDRTRIQQVLNNLVGNAIKFTDQGGIKVWVTKLKKENHKIVIRVAVEDTGTGIPLDEIERLKKPFEQATQSNDKKTMGSGLGLYISDQILAKMDSKINIKSTLGNGSTFYFDVALNIDQTLNIHTAVPGTNVTLLTQPGKDFELLSSYFSFWKFDIHRLPEWDDMTIQRTSNLLFLDESMASKYLSKLKQLQFNRQKRIIIIKDINRPGKDFIAQDWRGFEVIQKPILPSELYDLVLGKSDTVVDANNNTTHRVEDNVTTIARFTSRHPNCRILCVDDNHVNQLVLKKQLQNFGFNMIQIADNGQQALHLAKDTEFDAIFMDFNMPILDGVNATRILRQRGYTKPICGITALDADETQRGLNEGMTDVLHKPVGIERLGAFIVDHIIASFTPSDNVDISQAEEDNEDNKVLIYVADRETLQNQPFIDDLLKQLGLVNTATKVLSSEVIRREDIEDVSKVIVDISTNVYSQMRIASRLRRFGFSNPIIALSPVESDVMSSTFHHFGFNESGTANRIAESLN